MRAEEVARFFRAGTLSHEEWLESGRFLVDLLSRTIGQDDLSEVELLDVGCGTLIVKTLHDNSLPIRRYTGIDVSAEVIEWLRANFSDPRFDFHHMDARNAMYNTGGKPLADFDQLPFGSRRFDLISLFSVFTHLAPDDFVAMLRLLRRHIKPDGTLIFSLFITDPTQTFSYEQALQEQLDANDHQVRTRAAAKLRELELARRRTAAEYDPRFVDEVPDRPLLRAHYAKDYALELVDGTGWEIEAIHPPERYIQHYMVCHPT